MRSLIGSCARRLMITSAGCAILKRPSSRSDLVAGPGPVDERHPGKLTRCVPKERARSPKLAGTAQRTTGMCRSHAFCGRVSATWVVGSAFLGFVASGGALADNASGLKSSRKFSFLKSMARDPQGSFAVRLCRLLLRPRADRAANWAGDRI